MREERCESNGSLQFSCDTAAVKRVSKGRYVQSILRTGAHTRRTLRGGGLATVAWPRWPQSGPPCSAVSAPGVPAPPTHTLDPAPTRNLRARRAGPTQPPHSTTSDRPQPAQGVPGGPKMRQPPQKALFFRARGMNHAIARGRQLAQYVEVEYATAIAIRQVLQMQCGAPARGRALTQLELLPTDRIVVWRCPPPGPSPVC